MSKHGRKGLITDIAELKARCRVDPATHCWHWLGAATGRVQQPAIWAFDHARCEKRTMSGMLAAWNIAHGEAPTPGYFVFRACCNPACLNPVHLKLAKTRAEIGLHQRRAGSRRGKSVEARRQNIRLAWAAQGVTPTPDEIVLAIRAEPKTTTGLELAKRFGLSHTTVSRIRRGDSHRGILGAENGDRLTDSLGAGGL